MTAIGISGAQRVGKSTLAEAFAKDTEIAFVKTPTSEIFAALGYDPKIEYPIDERVAIQEAILYGLEKLYATADQKFPIWIADRTPIDLAGYMLADIQRSTLVGIPGLADLVNGYVGRCIEATNRRFSTVVLVQPGIPLVEEAGKAPACPAFIEHLTMIQAGLLLDPRLQSRHYMIPRHYTGLQDRIESVKNAVIHSVDTTVERKLQREAVGIRLH